MSTYKAVKEIEEAVLSGTIDVSDPVAQASLANIESDTGNILITNDQILTDTGDIVADTGNIDTSTATTATNTGNTVTEVQALQPLADVRALGIRATYTDILDLAASGA